MPCSAELARDLRVDASCLHATVDVRAGLGHASLEVTVTLELFDLAGVAQHHGLPTCVHQLHPLGLVACVKGLQGTLPKTS